MRGASLTLRGGCFLASGVAASMSAYFFGHVDLLRIGLLLLAVPLAALVLLLRNRVRLTASRMVEPRRISIEENTRVALRLTNVSRLPTGTLLLEDTLPLAVRARPRFVVDRLAGREHRDVSYTVRPALRGRFRLGPLTLRLTDPLGLWEIVREFPSVADLLVTPRVIELPARTLSGRSEGGQLSALSSGDGEDDVGVREYRHGDPMRRVHWRATARYGEVMVRREESPEPARALILLDNRDVSHNGVGRRSSFEAAVSACASLATALDRRGYGVSVQATSGPDTLLALDSAGLMDAMATVQLSRSGIDFDGIARAASGGGRGRPQLVIAVVRQVQPELTRLLGVLPGRGIQTSALLLAADSSDEGEPLIAAGWRVITCESMNDLAAAWPKLIAPAIRGTSWRAPRTEAVTPGGAA